MGETRGIFLTRKQIIILIDILKVYSIDLRMQGEELAVRLKLYDALSTF